MIVLALHTRGLRLNYGEHKSKNFMFLLVNLASCLPKYVEQ